MKIALQVGVPEQEQLNAFMHALDESPAVPDDVFSGGAGEVISAYDCGRLVGVGSRIETPEHAQIRRIRFLKRRRQPGLLSLREDLFAG